MKNLITTVVMAAFFSILAAGLTMAAEQPKSSSKNFSAPIAQTGAAEAIKTKKVKLITFTGTRKKTPISALFGAQDKAKEWLELQNAETIISQSQTVSCAARAGQNDNCDAFVTVMYWSMENVKVEAPKFVPPTVQIIEPKK